MSLALQSFELETGPSPTASFIVLHGLGADGRDFVSFVEELSLDEIGPVRFIFPNAPEIAVTVNAGHVMRAWYDIAEIDLLRREDEGGLRQSQAAVSALIDRERERGIEAGRIVLGGFSQGCAMTLMAGLRYPQRLAGLACLSGYLPLAAVTEAERHEANRDVPVFMAHGRHDPVIPIARALASRDALIGMGFDLEWHDYPMPHSVCVEEVADLNRWLLRVLA